MRVGPRPLTSVVLLSLLLFGCGGDKPEGPPNTFLEGVVKEVKLRTSTSKLVGEISRTYEIKFTVDGAARDWYGTVVSGRLSSEDDLRRAIGQRVSFSCYRDDKTITTCHGLASLKHNGRELVRNTK